MARADWWLLESWLMSCESLAMVVDDDPERLHLEVYDTKVGLWHPERGDMVLPDGWEFLPAGDAFLTRRVKAAGDYWTLFRPKGRSGHRRQLGLLAPTAAISAARTEAAETAARRAVLRDAGARQRERTEAAYRAEFADAVVRWLDFAPAHCVIASEIAAGAAAQAAVVGSGRVGRTKTLSLDERAALAARAFIRHHHTDYEDRLSVIELGDRDVEEVVDYKEIKWAAQRAVDAFLVDHRKR